MLVYILSQVSVIQTDWYNGPERANLSPFCQNNPTNLICSNDCPLVTNPPHGSFSNKFCKHDGNIFYLFQGKLRLKGVFRTILEHSLDPSVGGWDNDPDIFDVNKDGFLDLVVTDEQSPNRHAWVYFNPYGCGNFSQANRVTAVNDIESIDEIDEGDADRDGDIDLFTVGHSNHDEDVVLLINNGNSTNWSKCVICMDLNGNNCSNGTGEAEGIAVGDLDNDGDLDIAVTQLNDGRVYWFEKLPNNSNLGFGCNNIDGKNHRYNRYEIYSGGTGTAWDAWIADMNNDGRRDIIVTTQREVMWFRNNGGSPLTFTRFTIENNNNANFYALWVKDINNDGDLDIVVTDRAGRIRIYRNDGLGSFPNNWQITINVNNPMGVVIADLEPDGDQDIFVASYVPNDKRIYAYENTSGNVLDNQNINFTQIIPANVPQRSYFGLGVGDVDSDADPDLVVRAGTNGNPEGLYWYSTELLYVNRGIMISNVVDINGIMKTWKLHRIELIGFDPLNCQAIVPNEQFYYRYTSSSNWTDIYNQNWIGPITNFPYTPPSTQMVKYIQYMLILNSLNNNERTPVVEEVRFIFDTLITPVSAEENENKHYYKLIKNKIQFNMEGHVRILKLDGTVYKEMKVKTGDEITLKKGIYIIQFTNNYLKLQRNKIVIK
ncbi:MAG: VCBS repeat-containing protein [candidate division WOR-3 bacterium]|nr:VCBS repeat-containing protein [candidate division WOR-3 bacterium]MDW8150780.1 VCBS repeat-containing protein [candidate division WOR-3 bacterium]